MLCPSRAKRAERLNDVGSRGLLRGPWWGPGATTGGGPGAESPEAVGFSGFLRPQNASPCIHVVFLSFLRQVLL